MIDEHDRHHDLQPLARALLVLPASAPPDVVAGGHATAAATVARASCTNPPTSRPCTLSSTVASSSPFSDEIIAGPRACSMRASCPSGICGAAWRADEHLCQRLRVGPVLGPIAHPHREPRSAFDRGRQHRLADGVLDHLLHVADADPVPGRGRAVDLDVQVLAARDLLRIDVAGAGHACGRRRPPVAPDPRASRDRCRRSSRPTSDRMPVVSMSIRLMIGIVQMFDTPGICTARPISARRRSSVMPARHWSRGLRWTTVSVMFSGAGSVDVSARATLATA